MSKPHQKPYSITVFIVEGIKKAVLITTIGSRITESHMTFASPGRALTWARKHRAGLVYAPAENLAGN